MTKYRLSRYRYKSWQIEEYVQNKKKDTWQWKAIKFPGRLRDAVQGMVDLGFNDFTSNSAQDILDKLSSIEERLLEVAKDGVEFDV